MEAGIAALIAAAIAAIGGYVQSRSAANQVRDIAHTSRQAAKLLKPKAVLKQANKALPAMRANVAAGIGPGVKESVDAAISQNNLGDSGAGAALDLLSESLPGIIASQNSLSFATTLQGARANALLGSAGIQAGLPTVGNPLLSGLVSGGIGGLTTYLEFLKNQQSNSAVKSTLIPKEDTGPNGLGY